MLLIEQNCFLPLLKITNFHLHKCFTEVKKNIWLDCVTNIICARRCLEFSSYGFMPSNAISKVTQLELFLRSAIVYNWIINSIFRGKFMQKRCCTGNNKILFLMTCMYETLVSDQVSRGQLMMAGCRHTLEDNWHGNCVNCSPSRNAAGWYSAELQCIGRITAVTDWI